MRNHLEETNGRLELNTSLYLTQATTDELAEVMNQLAWHLQMEGRPEFERPARWLLRAVKGELERRLDSTRGPEPIKIPVEQWTRDDLATALALWVRVVGFTMRSVDDAIGWQVKLSQCLSQAVLAKVAPVNRGGGGEES